jgi:hypothetical protein
MDTTTVITRTRVAAFDDLRRTMAKRFAAPSDADYARTCGIRNGAVPCFPARSVRCAEGHRRPIHRLGANLKRTSTGLTRHFARSGKM